VIRIACTMVFDGVVHSAMISIFPFVFRYLRSSGPGLEKIGQMLLLADSSLLPHLCTLLNCKRFSFVLKCSLTSLFDFKAGMETLKAQWRLPEGSHALVTVG